MSTLTIEQLPEEIVGLATTPEGMERARAAVVAAFSSEAESERRRAERRAKVQRSATAIQALFAEWAQEDSAMTSEEVEQARRESEEFQANMNSNRVAVGEEPVY